MSDLEDVEPARGAREDAHDLAPHLSQLPGLPGRSHVPHESGPLDPPGRSHGSHGSGPSAVSGLPVPSGLPGLAVPSSAPHAPPSPCAAAARPWTSQPHARAWVQTLPLADLIELLARPTLHDALPALVPLLKVSDVIPCLRAPGMAPRILPHLDRAQCRLLGPELASWLAAHLHLAWPLLAHLPLETVVLLPARTFTRLPISVLRRLPHAHRHYVSLYVRRVRSGSRDEHDQALYHGLSRILHLHVHKILDPQHLPAVSGLHPLARMPVGPALRDALPGLRWLVEAVMCEDVKAVQLGPLRLSELFPELRSAGLPELAAELERAHREDRRGRARCHGASGIAYTADRAIAVEHARVDYAPDAPIGAPPAAAPSADDDALPQALHAALAGALREASARHAGLGPNPSHPLPTRRHVAVITIDLPATAPPPPAAAWTGFETVLAEPLDEPREHIAIHEVQLRWSSGVTRTYRRHGDRCYLPTGT
ncbi:MAG TPA: hypothetical protein VFT22_39710 [Kofleriaceae bacterium]|nr:hypothetical protein [Kofleriaceae bacterium]